MDIKARHLSFSYGKREALRGVDLDFAAGTITGIIGPNGSGKTTLLHCLMGLLKARGEILLDGRLLSSLRRKDIARAMGLVSQKEEIHFPFTVKDVLLMGRYPRLAFSRSPGVGDYRRVQEVAAMMEITAYLDRPVNTLSGGEFQRVMVARALAQEPGVLLLDEPTLHLDLRHQVDILQLISNISDASGLTVIMVSHDLLLAARFCDTMVVMDRGSVVTTGTAEKTLTPELIGRVYGVSATVTHDRERGLSSLVLSGHRPGASAMKKNTPRNKP
jgi:iron complex transport system ATP-binding protein